MAEPGSWAELAESTAFVFRAGGLALHPVSIALCAAAALAASWALPSTLESLLPWQGDQGVLETLWAWLRLALVVFVVCLTGVVLARIIAARPSQAEVWRVLGPQLASAGLCASTYVATLAGAMLASWLAAALGGWLDNAFVAGLAVLIGFAALLAAALASVLVLLAVPAAAANDADAPDAIQRAAAHLIARPGLTVVLVAISLALAAAGAWATQAVFGLAFDLLSSGWDDPPVLAWLPNTLALFVGLGIAWAALTQTLLTLREVVDREDRATCWDPRPQAAAIRAAVQARAELAQAWREEQGQPHTGAPGAGASEVERSSQTAQRP